ncbi:MAG: hypothetical protein HDQ88_02285 [Clostridia bacterium]|nr:hypothetical protein [Clostridia bacterium]
MSGSMKLSMKLKGLQEAISLSGLSMLCVNALGELVKAASTKTAMLHETNDRTLDADAAVEPGIYLLPSNAENAPKGISRGVMIVMKFAPNIYQLLITRAGKAPAVFVRLYTNESNLIGWTDWHSLSLTAM